MFEQITQYTMGHITIKFNNWTFLSQMNDTVVGVRKNADLSDLNFLQMLMLLSTLLQSTLSSLVLSE